MDKHFLFCFQDSAGEITYGGVTSIGEPPKPAARVQVKIILPRDAAEPEKQPRFGSPQNRTPLRRLEATVVGPFVADR